MSPIGDYYQELSSSPEPGQRAGWRHRLEQWLRFELCAAALRPSAGDLVADLGCGPAALAAYLHPNPARYLGVERHPTIVAQARETLATLDTDAQLLQCDLFDESVDRAGPFTYALAIGTLVSGDASTPRQRAERACALLRRVLRLAGQGAALFVLDQAALDADPIRSLEPALLGIYEHEIRELQRELDTPLNIAQPIPGEWMILSGARGMKFDAIAERARCVERVLDRWTATVSDDPADHAWLWWIAGEQTRALNELQRVAPAHPRYELLRQRMMLT